MVLHLAALFILQFISQFVLEIRNSEGSSEVGRMPSPCKVITFQINFAFLCQLTLKHKVVKYYPSKTVTLNTLSARGFLMKQRAPETKKRGNARLSID